MSYSMPIKADESRLYAAVASLPCQICGRSDVQVSHSNQLRDGKGRGLRSFPWRVAALCVPCHTDIDSGKSLTKEQRRDLWDEAHRKTIGELFERGLIRPVVKLPIPSIEESYL